MARSRGRRRARPPAPVEQCGVYINTGTTETLSVKNLSIAPGKMSVIDDDIAAHPAVQEWVKSGKLIRYVSYRNVRRMVDDIDSMRILVIVHTMFRGGAEVSTLELHRSLKEKGAIQCLLVLYSGDRDLNTMLTEDAKDIFDLYEDRHMSHGDSYKEAIVDMVNRFHPDLVLYSTLAQVPNAIGQIEGRPPLIQVMHSELPDSVGAYSDITDAVITVSRHMARGRMEAGIPETKLFPVWNGINPSRLMKGRSLRTSLKIPTKSTILAMVGNLNEIKRPIYGLEAFARVYRKTDYMIFVGNPAELFDPLNRRIHDLGLMSNVRVLGFRHDIASIYATMDLLLNCSTTEGLPMTILEAMFCGKPVIASAVGGNTEAVKNGSTGLIFPANDHNQLDACLRRLLRDSEMRATMGAAGKERAMSNFSMDVIVGKYQDVFRRYLFTSDDLRCSIVMPCYNAARTIRRALNSIQAQSLPYFELIAVDDGSEDNTLDILRKYAKNDPRIKVIEKKHTGIVDTLNRGIMEARTDFIVRMDADDEMLPHRLQVQMEFMDNHPDIDVMGSQMLYRDRDGHGRGSGHPVPISHGDIVEQLKEQNAMCHPTVVIRKKPLLAVGGYKGDGQCEDYRLWTDMAIGGCRFANISDALLIYTLTHDGDTEYHQWRDSVLPGIRESYIERLGGVMNGATNSQG